MLRTLALCLAAAAATFACDSDDGVAADTEHDASAGSDASPDGASGESDAAGDTAVETDASPPDAAPDVTPPDAAPPACEAVCARFADCSIEVCEGYEAADRGDLTTLCQATCEANPSFEVVAGGVETCIDLVAFGVQSTGDAGYAAACDGAMPPVGEVPECADFGAKVVECLVEACEGLASIQAGMTAFYTYYCNTAVSRGQAAVEQLRQIANPNSRCDSMFLRNFVTEQTTDTPQRPDDGSLARFCAEGPLVPAETCADACATVSPCIPAGDAENEFLRDPVLCETFCQTNPALTAAGWTCIAETEAACVGVTMCVGQNQPMPMPVAECEPYGARLAECAAGACEAVGAVEAGLARTLQAYCNQLVSSGGATAADVAMLVNAETPCEGDAMTALVMRLTTDDPEVADDGQLAGLCSEGPVTPIETCDAGCAVVGPCIPDGSEGAALRDLEVCRYFCAVSAEVPTERWMCIAEADDCAAALACTQP